MTHYRLLNEGETLKSGDEYLSLIDHKWYQTTHTNKPVKMGVFRRKIKLTDDSYATFIIYEEKR